LGLALVVVASASARQCRRVEEIEVCVAGEGAETIVLAHGFPDTPSSWDSVAASLIDQGFRVAVMTLPGYERNRKHPETNVYISQLARRTAAMLRKLAPDGAHFVGHDWGAALTYALASDPDLRDAHLLRSVTALAVPPLNGLLDNLWSHPSQVLRSSYMLFFQVPYVPEFALSVWDNWFIQKLWSLWSPSLEHPHPALDAATSLLSSRAQLVSSLRYYRQNVKCVLFDYLPSFMHTDVEEAGRTASILKAPLLVDTLLILGEQDGCMSPGFSTDLLGAAEFADGVTHRVEMVDGAGHFVQVEASEQVAAAIAAWVREHS